MTIKRKTTLRKKTIVQMEMTLEEDEDLNDIIEVRKPKLLSV